MSGATYPGGPHQDRDRGKVDVMAYVRVRDLATDLALRVGAVQAENKRLRRAITYSRLHAPVWFLVGCVSGAVLGAFAQLAIAAVHS